MPYINVQFTKGATKEAKREIVKGVTDLMVEHLGKRPEHVHVVIQEVEFEDWGFAGKGSVLMSGVNLHGGVAATVGLRKLEVTTPSPITERHHDDRGQDGID